MYRPDRPLQPKDIFERLSADPEQVAKRPLLSGDDPQGKLEALMEARKPLYAQVRAWHIVGSRGKLQDVRYVHGVQRKGRVCGEESFEITCLCSRKGRVTHKRREEIMNPVEK